MGISLKDVVKTGSGLPSRLVVYGSEGTGKTSLGARLKNSLTIQVGKETGLETLIDSGQVTDAAHTPAVTDWDDLVAFIGGLDSDHPYKWLVVDTLNGVEELCEEMVLKEYFRGQRQGKDGFNSYGKGFAEVGKQWTQFLHLLDVIRNNRKMGILLLAHSKVERFINPESEDFDRYAPALNKNTWAPTHKWADAVLRLDFETIIDNDGDRAKGVGGRNRVLYTENHDAYVAKNRHGLPAEILLGTTADEAVKAFIAAFRASKNGKDAA